MAAEDARQRMLGQTVVVALDDVVVGARKRPLSEARVAALAGSIAAVGLLQPIVVTDTMGLIAGRHRLEAARRLGWQSIPACVAPLSDLRAELAEIDENLVRNELSILEQGEHLAWRCEILTALGERAQAGWHGNQHAGPAYMAQNGTVGSDVAISVGGALSAPPKTTDDLAVEMGISKRSAQERLQIARGIAPEVKEAIAGTPLADRKNDLLALARLGAAEQRSVVAIEGVTDGEVAVPAALRRVVAQQKGDTPPLPSDKYRVIYADPPWQYGNTMPDYMGVQDDHYPTMRLPDICALPVADMAEDNAVLFLWVTSPILEESFEVIRAWGFRYKASFVWDKVGHVMGHYNSVRHEFLLVCTRGSCQPDVARLFDSVQSIERTAHSAKPEAFREIIDTIYPYGRRIELFARRPVAGWEVWGNEPGV